MLILMIMMKIIILILMCHLQILRDLFKS